MFCTTVNQLIMNFALCNFTLYNCGLWWIQEFFVGGGAERAVPEVLQETTPKFDIANALDCGFKSISFLTFTVLCLPKVVKRGAF